jgi:tetratricopeptide (TPR) repeat protein
MRLERTIWKNGRITMRRARIFVVVWVWVGLWACATSSPTTSSVDTNDQADRELKRGVYWYQKGCMRKAMEHFRVAHEHYSLADRQAGVARSLNGLANVYRQTGDQASALLFYDAAVTIGRRCDDQLVVAQALANQAAVLIDAGEVSAAEVLLDEAKLLSRETDPVYAVVLNHQAVSLMKERRFDEAGALLEQAESLAAGKGSNAGATIRFTRGRLMMQTGDYPRAQQLFGQALEMDRDAGFSRGMAADLAAMAEVLEHQGEDEAALNCLNRSIKINALLENRPEVLDQLKHLEALARKTGSDVRVTVHFITTWMAGEAADAICR